MKPSTQNPFLIFIKNPASSNSLIFIAIIICGLALYFLPLQSTAFYYDDIRSIEQNDVIRSIDISKLFDTFNTRVLVGLSFALNYQLAGLHPVGYRLINLLIHCINAFLVFLLIKSTLNLYFTQKTKLNFALEWPAFFGAMLFLCHPIQTEPVNFITQRFVLMRSLFYLLTLYMYIKYRCSFKKEYLIVSLLTAVAAMFCKEFVVTLPFALALYEFYFLKNSKEEVLKRCKRLLPFFVIILIVPILLSRTPSDASIVANIADSTTIQDSSGKKVVIDITRAHNGMSRERYFLTEVNVLCTYIRLLFVPINQNLDYDYPLFTHMDGKTIVCGVFLISLLVVAVLIYKTYRIVSFGILWFFLALSVESSFIPIGHVIAEYRLYLASFGFVLLITAFIYTRRIDVKTLNMIAVLILIVLSIFTFQRNSIWRNETTLWEDIVSKSFLKERPHNNLGLSYDSQGKYIEALREYKKAIELFPSDPDPYYNSGVVYGKIGKTAESLAEYNKAIQLNPNYAEAYSNRATLFDSVGNYAQAISDYTQAIKAEPNSWVLYKNRGNSYYRAGKLNEALLDYNKGLELNPNDVVLYSNRAIVYQRANHFAEAILNYSKAIALNPKQSEYYLNRGNMYNYQGKTTEALADYSKAVELDPQYATAYDNQVITYYRLKQYDKAWLMVHKLEALPGSYDPVRIATLKKLLSEKKQ